MGKLNQYYDTLKTNRKTRSSTVDITDLKIDTHWEFGGFPFKLLDASSVLYERKYTDDGMIFDPVIEKENPYLRNESGNETGIPVQFYSFDRDGNILPWESKDGDQYVRDQQGYGSVAVSPVGQAMFPPSYEFATIGTWDQYLEVYAGQIRARFDRIAQDKIDAEEREKERAIRRKKDEQFGEDRRVVKSLLGSLFGLYSISNYDLSDHQVERARQLLEKHDEVRKANIELFTITSTVELDSDDDEPDGGDSLADQPGWCGSLGAHPAHGECEGLYNVPGTTGVTYGPNGHEPFAVEHEGVIELDDEDDEDDELDEDDGEDPDDCNCVGLDHRQGCKHWVLPL